MAGSNRHKPIHLIEYGIIRVILAGLSLFPMRFRGALIARFAGFILPKIPNLRRRLMQNLDLIYPGIPRSKKLTIATEVVSNSARSLSELLMNKEFRTRQDLFEASGPGLSVLQRAKEEGKGAIIVSAHFGQWEAIRHVLKEQDMETGAVYRENTNPFYEKLFLKNIRMGGEPIVARGMAGNKAMLKHLRNGGFFALLVDQKVHQDEVLPFLGKPAMTTTSPAHMALKFGIPLVPAFATRNKNGQTIDIEFQEPIENGDPLDMTMEINHRLEEKIRENPGQWYWLHKRWELPTGMQVNEKFADQVI